MKEEMRRYVWINLGKRELVIDKKLQYKTLDNS